MSDPLASRKLIALCLVLVATGFARLVHVTRPLSPPSAARPSRSTYEQDLLQLAAAIPLDSRVGYVSTPDEPNPFADSRYVMSTYALAPRVVVRGTSGVRHVVAFHDDEAGLAALCRQHGLVPVATAAGVALTVREEAR